MIVVEDDTAKGRRHEVFPAAGWSKIAPAMEIEEPTKKGIDHIEADIIPDQRQAYMTPTPEKTSPRKEKIEHYDDDADAQDQETDGEEECLLGPAHAALRSQECLLGPAILKTHISTRRIGYANDAD